jgi:hypothetical protein
MSSRTLFVLAAILGGGLLIYHFRDDLKWPFPVPGTPSTNEGTPPDSPAGTPSKPIIDPSEIKVITGINTDFFGNLLGNIAAWRIGGNGI